MSIGGDGRGKDRSAAWGQGAPWPWPQAGARCALRYMVYTRKEIEVAGNSDGLCVRMPLVKVTKGALRYELPRDTEGTHIHNIYVRKDAFPDGNFPDAIVVTVEPAPGEGG